MQMRVHVCVFPYTPSCNHFLSSVDGLATTRALVGPSKLLSQLGWVWVAAGTMRSRSDGDRENPLVKGL